MNLVLIVLEILFKCGDFIFGKMFLIHRPQAKDGFGAGLLESREEARENVAVGGGVGADEGRAGGGLHQFEVGDEFGGGLAVRFDGVVLQRLGLASVGGW